MKKIAIIGASYLQEPLVLKAKELGMETHCFAWEDGAVCKHIADFFYPISVLDKEKIAKKCEEIKIDGITTIATDIAVPTVCYVADKMSLISNSYESSINSTNKVLMRKKFEEFGVSSPKYLEIDFLSDIELSDFHFPLIVKPTDRSGSRGINKVANLKDLEKAILIACNESLNKKAIIEEFITGSEVSVESISWKGEHYILAITDKITTGSPNFVELAHHQPTILPKNIIHLLIQETKKALDALNIKYGAGHSEFKITEEGEIYCIEVGARMGGDFIGSHLVELSTGIDFLKGVLDIATGEDYNGTNFPTVKTTCSGVFFLSKETEQILPYFLKDNTFDVEKKILTPKMKKLKNSNDRSGYLIYSSKNRVDIL